MLLVLLYRGTTWCNVIHSQRLPFIILSYQSNLIRQNIVGGIITG